jgi:hypothetical protein
MGQGLSVFDDPKNLSLISTMAAGDIPPHFYMNSTYYFSYHYGFQILGASLMRLGGLFPWSAFDFSKALVGAFLIVLAYLLSYRFLQNEFKATMVTLVFTFATSIRYLLVLLPQSIQTNFHLRLTTRMAPQSLSDLLIQEIRDDAAPPIPFPFAYSGGIVAWPRIIAIQAGPSSIALLTLFLAWLLIARGKRRYSFLLLIPVFAFWAMSWESTYVLFWAGGIFILVYRLFRGEQVSGLGGEMLALCLSLPIALVQGGTLTEIPRKLIWGAPGESFINPVASIAGFSLRWPPAINSTDFGELSLTSPGQLLVALCELSPVLLLAPWITIWAWRRFKKGDWFLGALMISSWIGFLVPLFLRYENDRDITRFSAYAITVWTVLLSLLVWDFTGRGEKLFKYAAATALFLSVFGGFLIAGDALTATARTVISTILTPLDAMVTRDTWDSLPKDAEVFDSDKWRATALTGRLSRSALKTGVPSPSWSKLFENPSVAEMLKQGYRYVYIDEDWWSSLSSQAQAAIEPACVQVISEHRQQNRFRRLIDLSPCQTIPQ